MNRPVPRTMVTLLAAWLATQEFGLLDAPADNAHGAWLVCLMGILQPSEAKD